MEDRGPTVEVLLATYNGERFLREQIESIRRQDYLNIWVLARDDGSIDGTAAILGEYAARDPERFRVLAGGKRAGGARANFLQLMAAAALPYVCFADQDDVWCPEKVRLSVEAMRKLEERCGVETPLLVFSDLRVVDAELKTTEASLWEQARIRPESVHRLERLLGQNVVTGCTAMINRPMLELARRMPAEAAMHDRWIGLLAASMGAAACVRAKTVLYRQHGANVVGAAAVDDSLNGMAVRARYDTDRRRERWRSEMQAEALLRVHGAEMPAGRREVLGAYLRSGRSGSRMERVGTTLRYGFYRSGLLRNLAMVFDLLRARSDEGIDVEGDRESVK